jgi:hypothetical protein
MSTIVLLHKATQMGATASKFMLWGLGFSGGDSSSMSLWQGKW